MPQPAGALYAMAIRSRAALAAAAALCVLAGQARAATPAAGLFYERALMAAADGACLIEGRGLIALARTS